MSKTGFSYDELVSLRTTLSGICDRITTLKNQVSFLTISVPNKSIETTKKLFDSALSNLEKALSTIDTKKATLINIDTAIQDATIMSLELER